MTSWHEFVTMGGYAAYVWPAYGLAVIVLIANIAVPTRQHKRLIGQLKRRLSARREFSRRGLSGREVL
jgi:heme exporter protein D